MLSPRNLKLFDVFVILEHSVIQLNESCSPLYVTQVKNPMFPMKS